MNMRTLRDGVDWMGVVDWDRRVFDALIPLPDGTSYNSYFIRGRDKCALLDTSDPATVAAFEPQLAALPRVDYVISHHSEQDHSGLIPLALERFPQARVLASAAGRQMLQDLVGLPADRITVVKDGDTVALGGKTLRFITTPWVHWPDTFCTWLEEERILFSCDFFGSHLATTDLYVRDTARVEAAAKRYYAEIMMPYAAHARKNLEKVRALDIAMIAPSHGPVYDCPALILEAWQRWTGLPSANEAVLAYVSMHGSTLRLARALTNELAERGVGVRCFDLLSADLGQLAMALVDAATLVLGTPVVLNDWHPLAAYAAALVNGLKARTRFVSLLGSYGWNGKCLEPVAARLPEVPAEILSPVICKGLPREADLARVCALADAIAARHAQAGLAGAPAS